MLYVQVSTHTFFVAHSGTAQLLHSCFCCNTNASLPSRIAPLISRLNHSNNMNEDNNKRRHETEPTPEDFILIGKDIQNKSGRPIGSASTEERAFREFFGTTAVVVANLWRIGSEQDIIPGEGTIQHLLWALHFTRVYPKEGAAFATVGGLGGAIDPKTLRKYIWPFIYTIANLS